MKNKQSFIKGALILGIAAIIAKFLGVFFRWPVTMLIGDEGIGLYQLSYPIYMFIISILMGFPVAISSMVSKRMALNRRLEAYRIFKYSLVLMAFLGLMFSLILYISAPYIVRFLKWREEAYYSLLAVAFAPFFVAIMNCFRGYFQGLQMMTLPAASQIIEQIGRVVIGVGLTFALLPYGIGYSAAGASFGACAGAVLGCIMLVSGYIKSKNDIIVYKSGEASERRREIAKELIRTAIPISIGMTVGSIMALIDSVIVPARLLSAGFGEKMATELYGQLTGKAHVLVNVPLTFSVALGTSLVPAMAEVKAQRNISRIKSRAESAIKTAILMGLPSAAGLFILADPILNLVFPGQSKGSGVLQILSVSIVFVVLVNTLVSILQGVGNVMAPVRNLMIGSAVKLVLVYVLTAMPLVNIRGAAISSIAGYFIAALLNYKDAVRCTYISFDIDKMLLRPALSTLLMAIGVYEAYNRFINLTGSNGISTIISIITGIIIYVSMVLITRCVSIDEVRVYWKYRKKQK